MSLLLQRLVMRCRAPRRVRIDPVKVEREARAVLGPALGRRLAAWDGSPEVVCLPRLHVRLTLSVQELAAGRLGEAFAEAFTRSLGAALGGPGVVRLPGRGAWLAQFLGDWARGLAQGEWRYAEFFAHLSAGLPRGLCALAQEEPAALREALAELAHTPLFDALLDACPESALAELAAALSSGASGVPRLARFVELAEAVAALTSAAPAGVTLAVAAEEDRRSRWALALRLWLQSGETENLAVADLFHALGALDCLLRHGAGSTARRHPALDSAALAWMRIALQVPDNRALEHRLETALRTVREALALPAPGAIAAVPWQETSAAGLLWLVPIIDRLGWRERALVCEGGREVWPFALAGAALALRSRPPSPSEPLDPAAALLAGWTGTPDTAGLRARGHAGPSREATAFLHALGLAEGGTEHTWPGAWELMAAALLRAFAGRLPGFADATRPYLLRHFIEIPGRLRVEERRAIVQFEPIPLHVVIRLASLDLPIEAVPWLENRRLEYDLPSA